MDFGFKVGGGVTMGFKPGSSFTFGFDVGGGSPEPTPQADEPPMSLNVMMIQGSYGQFFIPEFTPFGQAEVEE